MDLGGMHLLPGAVNLHIRIPGSGKPTKKNLDYGKAERLLHFGAVRVVMQKICENNAKQLLSETTTIRAVGGVLNVDIPGKPGVLKTSLSTAS